MKTNVKVTSLFSYHGEVQQKLGDKQASVMEVFENAGRNITNSELAFLLGWTINTVTPRVYELRKMGKLEKDEYRKCGMTGRNVIAWKLKLNQ